VVEKRKKGETPRRMVRRLAMAKAKSVAKLFPDDYVLGADTVVVCRGKLFGKPENQIQAKLMIQQLQGRVHSVWTGVALVGEGGNIRRVYAEKTKMFFRRILKKELSAYLKNKEPYDKAGAYDIQETARYWVKRWDGDYFNVMGLPVQWVIQQTNHFFNYSNKF
jgi:septum formation protein